MKILFTTGRFPYPLLHGEQLLSYFRIQQLARKHEVTLLSFLERPEDMQHVRHLQAYCSEINTVLLPPWRSCASVLRGALSPLPLQVLYYASSAYQEKLREILARRKFDVIHTVLSRAAHHTIEVTGTVKVCEIMDTLSLTMKLRAEASPWPLDKLWGMEAERMRRFERRICKSFDGVVVITEPDRRALDAPNVSVIAGGVPGGVDLAVRPKRNGHKLVIFTGNLAYRPNREAAIYLLKEIWPAMRQALPGARLRIVGNNPGPGIRRAAQPFPDVEVTGFVPDVRQYLRQADVAVVPIRSGGNGIQTKALEAMACGTPVVVSSLVKGIQGLPGKDFLVAADAEDYVQATRSILDNPALAMTLSENGRQLVAEKYSWAKNSDRLESLYEELLDRRFFAASHAHRN